MDIGIENAMLCWDSGTGRALVVRHPDRSGLSDEYGTTVGACFRYWSDLDERGRKLQLLIEAWHGVAFGGIPAQSMHKALLVVPEYRSMLADDCLPPAFRGERG